MKRIGNIEKYCIQEGYRLKYQYCQFMKHIGGRGFYNDGTYMVDIYKLSVNGKIFELYVKTTGRPLYWILYNDENIVVAFNQKGLLKCLEENKDMYGNPIF